MEKEQFNRSGGYSTFCLYYLSIHCYQLIVINLFINSLILFYGLVGKTNRVIMVTHRSTVLVYQYSRFGIASSGEQMR